MKTITRRTFLKQTVTTTAVLLSEGYAQSSNTSNQLPLKQVKLAQTGIQVSCLALGTGTRGWVFKSNQTKLGEKGFIDLAQHAFDAGITFFDTADIYGSHKFLRAALKYIPREKIVILTKIWTSPNDWIDYKCGTAALDRFRKEIGTDYLDIVLIHCQTSANWPEEQQKLCDELTDAKAKGIIRAHGVSCHSLPALKAAAASSWVDLIFGRINHTGAAMDDVPERVMPVLEQAHNRGKAVVGIKIFGCGKLVETAQREASLRYVLTSGHVDALSIGFESCEQINDTIRRIGKYN